MPSHGDRKRDAILQAAMDVSSAEGLGGLTIGRLAREIGMSKSGLFAHFGSKEELQLATVRFAADDYEREVIAPPQAAEPGLSRLRALMSCWVRYIDATSNRGGCFFDAASSEFGSRPGPVRELLARYSRNWLHQLEEQARLAHRLGELRADADPELLVFRLHAYVEEANWSRELFQDERAFEKARAAIDETLGAASAAPPTEENPR